jgi:hypothetical protein
MLSRDEIPLTPLGKVFRVQAIDNARRVLILGNPDEDQRNLLGPQRAGS